METYPMSLADRLYDLRQNAKVSLQIAADAVGVSKAHLWELEKGRTANPSFDLVRKLAAYYGVTPETLIGEDDAPPSEDQQVERIHRELKGLTSRDRDIIEAMVKSMRTSPAE
jgi:transcriptional regulator with XRE-family HTH domain